MTKKEEETARCGNYSKEPRARYDDGKGEGRARERGVKREPPSSGSCGGDFGGSLSLKVDGGRSHSDGDASKISVAAPKSNTCGRDGSDPDFYAAFRIKRTQKQSERISASQKTIGGTPTAREVSEKRLITPFSPTTKCKPPQKKARSNPKSSRMTPIKASAAGQAIHSTESITPFPKGEPARGPAQDAPSDRPTDGNGRNQRVGELIDLSVAEDWAPPELPARPSSPHNTRDTAIVIDSSDDEGDGVCVAQTRPKSAGEAEERAQMVSFLNVLTQYLQRRQDLNHEVLKQINQCRFDGDDIENHRRQVTRLREMVGHNHWRRAQAHFDRFLKRKEKRRQRQRNADGCAPGRQASGAGAGGGAALSGGAASKVDANAEKHHADRQPFQWSGSVGRFSSVYGGQKKAAGRLAASREVSWGTSGVSTSRALLTGTEAAATPTAATAAAAISPSLNVSPLSEEEDNDPFGDALPARKAALSPVYRDITKPFRCKNCKEWFTTYDQAKLHEKRCKGLSTATRRRVKRTRVKAERDTAERPRLEKEPAGEKEEGCVEEEEDEITYTSYRPNKLKFGMDHPDPVVENSTLSAVQPPDVKYNLAMPASILSEGRLSNLQLEAIVYGCQRHMEDLPVKPPELKTWGETGNCDEEGLQVPLRAGFLLGDGAGMGKGRTLAGFVIENIARGRRKHLWISVSADLYEDAKRDLKDLGLERYAKTMCHNLGKLPYGSLQTIKEGAIFVTYSTLISKNREGTTRLDELVEWCEGVEFEGLLMLDECHKAKTIELNADGSLKMEGSGSDRKPKSSQTATKVVQLQQALPRARVVYCSATSVSHPKNLAFMSRLGLWGYGTEHPMGFNQFLEGLKRLGTGAMELHAMHLKSIGALCARTLSYESCEFELVDGIGDDKVRGLYNQASEIWTDLHAQLADRCTKLNKREEMELRIARLSRLSDVNEEDGEEGPHEEMELSEEMQYHLDLHGNSDSETDDDEEDAKKLEEKRLRRLYRARKSKFLRGLFWSSHQRFFRSLCIASKVGRAISLAKKALDDGHCCVIGLQSTGEARSKGAALAAGYNDDDGGDFNDFVSAPNEDLKRIILMMFPLPPKPRGVIAPVFLTPVQDRSETNSSDQDANPSSTEDARRRRRLERNRNKRRNLSIGENAPSSKRIQWDEIALDLDVTASVENERLLNYRIAAEKIKKYLDAVDRLKLPANPLDRLVNELGGPDEVAELTGRKIRQIQRYDKHKGRIVSYERRKGTGRYDQINIEERNNFQSGKKLVAILSEASSTGISLQADKRVENQRRRVHITLELPWSADKAIQQLGRTHRANQTSGPIYKFLISDVGGEKRFAAAVAKRLALLGALTQGDRRATGQSNSLGLGGFDMDNKFGNRALRTMLSSIWECANPLLSEEPDSHLVEVLKLIDSHLTVVLDSLEDDWEDWRSNLAPRDGDEKSLQTFDSMMETLLLGPCLHLAENRVAAIKEGRSVAKYFLSLEDGTETKESVKPKIDNELEVAKEAGLNFNVLCYIWLFDVGVTEESATGDGFRAPLNVAKFLNRCLGMNLPRQKLLIDYFLGHLEQAVALAKSAGQHDRGINTISGHSIVINKPRSFCFRGLEGKDERLLLYKIKADRGMNSETAQQLYNEAKELEVGVDGNPGGGQTSGIPSGFYIDRRRDLFTEVPRMYLIINQWQTSEKCVVIRPNEGKKIYAKKWVKNKLINGGARLSLCEDVGKALETWNREFHLADRPSSERYQRYCYGRHEERFVFGGSIVTILNKILASANYNGIVVDTEEMYTMPSIVRVEPSGKSGHSQIEIEKNNEDGAEAELYKTNRRSRYFSDIPHGTIDGAPAIGQNVAREILGSVIFRGIITQVKCNYDCADGTYLSGKYTAKYTDGCIEMNANEAVMAKKLFHAEADKLIAKAKVPKADALSIGTISVSNSRPRADRRPVLAEGEEKETEHYERMFEEVHDDDIPNVLVGLEFPRKSLPWYSESASDHILIPFWEFVLRKLAERLHEEGVKTSRELLHLETTEKLTS